MIILREMLKVLSDPGVIASVIGSLVGGLFTYLAVILTFNKQKKDELPAKLLALTEIMFSIKTYQSNLYLLLHGIGSNNEDAMQYFPALKFDDLKATLVFKSLSVDKKTYQVIVKAFLEYSKLGYNYNFFNSKRFNEENVRIALDFYKDLSTLEAQINKRIAYYEKKLR
ncbi:hypothetical protein ACIQY5_19170 [Peribacillus frigoritolerans]|uniref:hypothetical protein n=1 Tax=Peribacillus frigoritolerans TaxID=450367 RepID=UPI0038220446